MDLGIEGRRARVCAASRGLGRACAHSLAREGVAVVINGRDAARLDEAAQAIYEDTGTSVETVVADLDREEDRTRLIAACPNADILVTNNGGPPPGRFEDWEHADWLRALESNLLAPLMLIRALLPGMKERGFGRIVNITSISVKMPIPGLDLSSAARAGLTSFLAGVVPKVAEHNVTINNILPGFFLTDRHSAALKQAM
ncbi:MAG: SDR family NAD(P)-dependent oxidoreductase, partial [Myxococcota bacterium]